MTTLNQEDFFELFLNTFQEVSPLALSEFLNRPVSDIFTLFSYAVSFDFSDKKNPLFFDLQRCSTADQSGLPDFRDS